MKLAIFAYSRRGIETARRVLSALSSTAEASIYTVERLFELGFRPMEQPSAPFYGTLFQSMDALIFVGAAGIAVRSIAPHVRDKRMDPAVLCVDELGQYVIPLLSGHIGGANALSRALADALGAAAVITTATDVNGRFSVDAWARQNGYVIDNMLAAKAVSAAILEADVPLCCDFPIRTELPPGVAPGDGGKVGIYIGWEKKAPFETTLRLIPKALRLGLGCRRGTDAAVIRDAVEAVFMEHSLDLRAVRIAASIDRKADEAGLVKYCGDMDWPLSFHSAEELNAVSGEFTPSAFVESVAGVDNVCERAAMLGADKLIVKKTARSGVTVAVAAENLEVRFG